MIHLLFILPLLKGSTGVSYPVDFLDRYITSSFTQPEEKFGFFYEIPTQLKFISLVYRNFSFESDGNTFLGFSSGTYAEKASLSLRGKLIFLNKTYEGFGTGIGYLQAPLNFLSIGFFAEGIYNSMENKTSVFAQSGISFHRKGFAINLEPSFTTDSIGFKGGATYIFNLKNSFFNSVKFYTGLQIFKNKIFSFGIGLTKDNMKFLIGSYNKKFYFGFVLDFKKRVVIKEIVKEVEVPVYVEKKEEKKEIKQPVKKKEEKPKEETLAVSEEELEYYYKKGIEFYKMEMLEEAIKSWEFIIKVKPDYKDTKKLYEVAKDRYEKLKRISE